MSYQLDLQHGKKREIEMPPLPEEAPEPEVQAQSEPVVEAQDINPEKEAPVEESIPEKQPTETQNTKNVRALREKADRADRAERERDDPSYRSYRTIPSTKVTAWPTHVRDGRHVCRPLDIELAVASVRHGCTPPHTAADAQPFARTVFLCSTGKVVPRASALAISRHISPASAEESWYPYPAKGEAAPSHTSTP